jgi:hypothetical protein
MRWFPKSKIGKISFWVGVAAFILMYLQYWVAMAFQVSIPIPMGIVVMLCICASGIGAIVALTKYKDRAIFVWLSLLVGLFGFVFVAGEFLFPH